MVALRQDAELKGRALYPLLLLVLAQHVGICGIAEVFLDPLGRIARHDEGHIGPELRP